jgi:hypothetical protein
MGLSYPPRTLQFRNPESGEQQLVLIRLMQNQITLGLSRETDGDVEIYLHPEQCRLLIEALQETIEAQTTG